MNRNDENFKKINKSIDDGFKKIDDNINRMNGNIDYQFKRIDYQFKRLDNQFEKQKNWSVAIILITVLTTLITAFCVN